MSDNKVSRMCLETKLKCFKSRSPKFRVENPIEVGSCLCIWISFLLKAFVYLLKVDKSTIVSRKYKTLKSSK